MNLIGEADCIVLFQVFNWTNFPNSHDSLMLTIYIENSLKNLIASVKDKGALIFIARYKNSKIAKCSLVCTFLFVLEKISLQKVFN